MRSRRRHQQKTIGELGAELTTPVARTVRDTKRGTWKTIIVGAEDIIPVRIAGSVNTDLVASTLVAEVTTGRGDGIAEKLSKSKRTFSLRGKDRLYYESMNKLLPVGEAWGECKGETVPAAKCPPREAEACARAEIQVWRECRHKTEMITGSSTWYWMLCTVIWIIAAVGNNKTSPHAKSQKCH